MGEPTPNLLLKQWAATDEKIQTWTDYNDNLLTIDAEISNAQAVLWSGATQLGNGVTVTPSKPLSECRSGWVLIWSDFDAGVGSNDYDFAKTFISKKSIELTSGLSYIEPIVTAIGGAGEVIFSAKTLKIFDDRLEGHVNNNPTGGIQNTSDICLRYVIGL